MKSKSVQGRSNNQTPISHSRSQHQHSLLEQKSRMSQQKSQYQYSTKSYEQNKYLVRMISKFKPNILYSNQPQFTNSRKQIIQIRDMDNHILFIIKHNETIYQKEMTLDDAQSLFLSFNRDMSKMIESIDVRKGQIVFDAPFKISSIPLQAAEQLLNQFTKHKVYKNNELLMRYQNQLLNDTN